MSDWFYLEGRQRIGPVDAKSLKALAQSGQLGPKDYVWKEGMTDWTEASRIKGLFPKAPPPPPPSAVPSETAVSPTIASPETVTPASRSLPESATATATSQSQTFGIWYNAKFGHLPIVGQVMLWLFYGFVWIPVYYTTSNRNGSSNADGESSPETAVSPTIASPETVTPASRSLPESATATATSQSQTFGIWYNAKFGHLPIVGQVMLWLFYGFVWIPVYYTTSNRNGSSNADGESSLSNLWFVLCCFPYLAFVGWLYAGIRSNHKPYFAWAVVYVVPCLLLFVAMPQPEAEPRHEVMVVFMFAWFAGIIHASFKRQEVNLRIKYASARKSGDVQLDARIRAEYEQEQPASANDATQADPTSSLAIPKQPSIVFRFFLFVGAAVGSWLITRLLDAFL